jgi:hypothetical protein
MQDVERLEAVVLRPQRAGVQVKAVALVWVPATARSR